MTNADVVAGLRSMVDWLESQENKYGPYLDPSSSIDQMEACIVTLRCLLMHEGSDKALSDEYMLSL